MVILEKIILLLQYQTSKIMRVNIHQFNYKTKDYEHNTSQIEEALKESNEDVLNIFSELALCGSPLFDSALYSDIYKETSLCGERLLQGKKSFIVGTIAKGEENTRYNALVFVNKGEVMGLSTKRNLGRFDENFSIGNGIETIKYEGKNLAFGFVEDFENFVKRKVQTDVVILCSNQLFDKDDKDENIKTLSFYARQMKTKIIYVNRVGGEGCFIFSGSSFVMNERGEICEKLSMFEQGNIFVDLDNIKAKAFASLCYEEKIFRAGVLGLRDYFHKNNINKAVIGLSGGVDSAVAVVLGAEALGKENITGVLMPSKYSSEHSVNDAKKSAENLGIKYITITIEDIFEASLKTMQPIFEGTEPNTAEENLQARARCMIIMAICNKIGAAMLNTSNKSESAVGYGTLYGDDSGAISVLGDLYKTDVYKLARWINKDKEIIPQNSIDKAPSAELRFDQKDSDSLPEYDILDKVLVEYIDNKTDFSQLIKKGYEEKLVMRILRLIKINEWKRHQEAPALRYSKTCFTTDYKQPIS
ncbi:MAG: NAD(+) synthase [Bacteroidota bacterium]|nr:NAD(+) synthase [Bacteroidota bacterium]